MKRGFTLIELLAVIVILAIIALTAIPVILGIIDDAKKGALKDSAYGLESAAEFIYAKSLIQEKPISDIVFTLKEGKITSSHPAINLDFKGDVLADGQLIIEKDGNIRLALYYNNYCISLTSGTEGIIEEKEKEECMLPDLPNIEPPIEGNQEPAQPDLTDDMIPIKWDGTKWVKADVTASKDWYDYDNKIWANAVSVKESGTKTREYYKSAVAGTAVEEADILTYMVWVPRYKYKLFNVSSVNMNPQMIDIIFEDKKAIKSRGTKNGEYLTHPAFTFGNTELNGIWVGKFETTGTITTPCVNEACTTANLTIKPNLASVTNQTVSSMFYATRSMQRSENMYGFTNSVDIHMMKNTEWGAVAYLTYSKYRKNSEVWINNYYYSNQEFITGCVGNSVDAASVAPCQNAYSSEKGINGSTTGNIYGIYDMSGGAWEYMMGAMYNNDNSTIKLSYSKFDQTIINSIDMSKYIDKYNYGSTESDQIAYDRRILGDATGETIDWNGDYAFFIYSSNSWFYRGGLSTNAINAGVFSFSNHTGRAYSNISFRVVKTAV